MTGTDPGGSRRRRVLCAVGTSVVAGSLAGCVEGYKRLVGVSENRVDCPPLTDAPMRKFETADERFVFDLSVLEIYEQRPAELPVRIHFEATIDAGNGTGYTTIEIEQDPFPLSKSLYEAEVKPDADHHTTIKGESVAILGPEEEKGAGVNTNVGTEVFVPHEADDGSKEYVSLENRFTVFKGPLRGTGSGKRPAATDRCGERLRSMALAVTKSVKANPDTTAFGRLAGTGGDIGPSAGTQERSRR